MATTKQYLDKLVEEKTNLAKALRNKGIDAQNSETFTSLIPKVSKISGNAVSGTISITKNGIYDVSIYKTADVDTSGGTTSFKPTHISFAFAQNTDLTYETQNIDTSNCTHFYGMFYQTPNLTKIDIKNWDTKNVNNMYAVFRMASVLPSVDVSNWNTSKVTTMALMFRECSKLLTIKGLNNFDVSNVESMNQMFYGCSSLADGGDGNYKIDLSNWTTSKVTNLAQMFYGCKSGSLKKIDISNLDTSKVTTMKEAFRDCTMVNEINLASWTSENVTDISSMFYGCAYLDKLDMRNFMFTEVNTYSSVFNGCNANLLIIVKDNVEKAWLNSHFSRMTNVKTVAEYEAQ